MILIGPWLEYIVITAKAHKNFQFALLRCIATNENAIQDFFSFVEQRTQKPLLSS